MKQSGFVVLSPDCYFDVQKGTVVVDDTKSVRLTRNAYRVLSFLVDHEGTVLTKNQILDAVWGSGYEGESAEQSLVNVISELRKIDDDMAESIKTVRGVGYVFEREKILEVKKMFASGTYEKEEKRKMLSKYLNHAISDRILVLNNKIEELFHEVENADKYDLDPKIKDHFQKELSQTIQEHDLLKEELFSDVDISRILHEPDYKHKRESSSSLCSAVTSELEALEERIQILKKMQKIVC